MALLDVSDIVLDPDFADTLQCIRSTQVIGTNGRASNTPVTTSFTGVVTQNEGDLLDRIETGQKIKGSITVHSKYPLIEGAPNVTADIVVWKGRQYTVTRLDDYSHFGRGFTAAQCDLLPIAG